MNELKLCRIWAIADWATRRWKIIFKFLPSAFLVDFTYFRCYLSWGFCFSNIKDRSLKIWIATFPTFPTNIIKKWVIWLNLDNNKCSFILSFEKPLLATNGWKQRSKKACFEGWLTSKNYWSTMTVGWMNEPMTRFRSGEKLLGTSFKAAKWPQTKWYTRKDTIFWHIFPYPFTWCAPFCCEC